MKIFLIVAHRIPLLLLAPIDTLATEENLDIAVEEAGAPTTQKKENVIAKWFNKLVLEPSKNVFYHLIPKCTPGTQFEYLFPITMIWSLVLIFLVTYVIAAVCQRWEVLLVTKAGFISFPFIPFYSLNHSSTL